MVIKPVAPSKYPPAAMAVRAGGEVSVSVQIDSDGKVISANGFSGHPLLRQVSETAARDWLFSKTSPGGAPRSTILFFQYRIGEYKMIEKSEKETEQVVGFNFLSPFVTEIRGDTLMPRLLLLSRTKDTINPEYCETHKELMEVELQRVSCDSRREWAELSSPSNEYRKVEEEEFPNTRLEFSFDCRSDGIEKAEVHFCRTCRLKREQWFQINKQQWLTN